MTQNKEISIRELLGDSDYEELQLKSVIEKANKGDFMQGLHPWLKTVNPHFNWDWDYTKFMIDRLQDLSDGKIRKLMVSLPPRSGKSELCAIHFPAYFLEKDPRNRVIVGTYNQTLANKTSRRVRSLARTRIDLDPDRKAMEEWDTKEGGGLRAVGVGAGIAGVGANLIVLDDIVRNRKDANSITVRNTIHDWYTDDIYTRLEPDSRILVLGTRWHEDDIIGRLVRADQDINDWVIINLPAIAEEDGDVLGRKKGEALNPERFPIDVLLDIRRVMGRSFNALYQGRPTEQEGEIFKASWFRNHLFDTLPKGGNERYEMVRFWDKASSTDGDYTVGMLIAKERISKTYYILDMVRGQWLSHERDKQMLKTAIEDQVTWGEHGHVKIRHEQEPGSSGKDAAKYTNKLLAGFAVKAIKTTGDKIYRAEPYASQCEAGNVFLINSEWMEDFIDEHAVFANGKHDDIVDASSGAFNELSKGSSFISFGRRG